MSVIGKDWQFLHVPKTGGMFVNKLLKPHGDWYIGNPNPHLPLKYADPGKWTFAFVRCPYSWLQSYWCWAMNRNWRKPSVANAPIKPIKYASDDFDDFVRKFVAGQPGAIGMCYEKFVGPPENEIDFVGRYESLAEDLKFALDFIGVKADLKSPRENAAKNHHRKLAVFRPGTKDIVFEAEKTTFERFGYDRQGNLS